MRTIYRSILFLLLSLVALPLAYAQSDRGNITGKVADKSGAVLPNATITLTDEGTGAVQTATSNASGDFLFQLLNPGTYTLSVQLTGFKTAERTHIVVDVNQTNQQNFGLDVGATTETVEVTTGVQQLQTETGSMGLVVEQRSIQELPLIYGNPFTLETLAPGLSLSGVNPNIHAYDSGTANVYVNGSLLGALEYRLDGAPDNRIRFSAYTPSTEFVNQYRVETATYDATQGHSGGGFVNTSLKSGTNAFHGSAFGAYQNPDLNTSFWHTGPSAPAKSTWLREGGDIGGPIWRNKAFFFTGLEHSRETTPNVQLLTVPSVAERNGDFRELYALDPAHPAGTSNLYQLYSPTTGKSGTCSGRACTTRTAISNNVLPSVDPIAAAILKYYPLPNTTPNAQGGGNYSYSASEPNYYYAYIVRADVNINSKQSLFAHWVQSRRLQPGHNGWFFPVSGTSLTYQNKGAALGYTYTINPATVLDAHLSWTRFINQSLTNSQGLLNATNIGMPASVVTGNGFSNAFPRIDVTGYQSLNSDSPVVSHDDISMASVQVSHLFGTHFVRGGAEYRIYNTNAGVGGQSNGRYQNTGTYTTANSTVTAPSIGFGLAQMEYGIPTSSAITVNSDFAVRTPWLGVYLHDDWKPTAKLTVNLGLRWEYEGANSERNQKANTFFDFNAVNPINAAARSAYTSIAGTNSLLPTAANFQVNGGLRFLGDSSTPFTGNNLYTSQKLVFLPRIGFSYQFAPQTVVRGGFGMFADQLSTFYLSGGNAGSTTTFLIPQQGFSQATTINASPDTGLTFTSTLHNPFPNGISAPTGSSAGLATSLGQAVTFQTPNPQVPYNERWSFGIQRQFGVWLAAVDYVGNHGVHLPIQREYDAVPRQYLSTATNGYDVTANTTLTASVKNPFSGIIPNAGSTTTVQQLLRPYPEFTSVTGYVSEGSSIYHSLQAQLNRRFSHGASLTSAFTWSKSLDATQYLNQTDPQPWYGLSQSDRTFRFATSGIYELPFGRNRAFLTGGIGSAVLGGWQVQGVYQVQSGQPLSFQSSNGTSPLYLGPGSPVNSAWGRGGFKASSNNLTQTGYWFNKADWATTTSVAANATGVVAGVAPNVYQLRTMGYRFSGLRADFLNQLDAAVQRNFSLSRVYEPLTLQIRADMINALNHPVYGNTSGTNNTPVTDWTSSTFGQVTAQTNQPRIYQFEAFIRF